MTKYNVLFGVVFFMAFCHGQNCDQLPEYNLDYFENSTVASTIKGNIRKSSEADFKCFDIYLYDGTTTVIHLVSDSLNQFEIKPLKAGKYDLELHFDGKFFRYYDLVVSNYETRKISLNSSQFLERKEYLKILKKKSKNRGR